MVLNNDRHKTLVYFLEKESQGIPIPEPLDLSKNLFSDKFKKLNIIISNNSSNCLSVICSSLMMNKTDDYEIKGFRQRLIQYFTEIGYLRALVMGS